MNTSTSATEAQVQLDFGDFRPLWDKCHTLVMVMAVSGPKTVPRTGLRLSQRDPRHTQLLIDIFRIIVSRFEIQISKNYSHFDEKFPQSDPRMSVGDTESHDPLAKIIAVILPPPKRFLVFPKIPTGSYGPKLFLATKLGWPEPCAYQTLVMVVTVLTYVNPIRNTVSVLVRRFWCD